MWPQCRECPRQAAHRPRAEKQSRSSMSTSGTTSRPWPSWRTLSPRSWVRPIRRELRSSPRMPATSSPRWESSGTSSLEEGQDVPPQVAKETTDLISTKAVKFLAYNTQTEGPQTQALKDAAVKAGVPVVDFTETFPEAQSYLQWMGTNVEHVKQALEG
jgi:hypothetical protein